jgi:two-component system response regulator FixJ
MTNRIAVVDDDAAVRESLSAILRTYGFETETHASAAEALEALRRSPPDCIILDVRMPEMDGLTMQRIVSALPEAPPVILITGHGDITMAVRAMKDGAHDFVEKPVDDEALVRSIRTAIATRAGAVRSEAEQRDLVERYHQLTERERTIADMVSEGYSTAAIAARLEISNRTVDHHRASIMAKMKATSLPQLLRFLISLQR